jgi:hypothetical protein
MSLLLLLLLLLLLVVLLVLLLVLRLVLVLVLRLALLLELRLHEVRSADGYIQTQVRSANRHDETLQRPAALERSALADTVIDVRRLQSAFIVEQ